MNQQDLFDYDVYDATESRLKNDVCWCGQCNRQLVSIAERLIGLSECCVLPEAVIDSESLNKLLEDVPFSCTCWRCENFTDHLTRAAIAGWRGIHYDDGPGWNFVGDCPECKGGE